MMISGSILFAFGIFMTSLSKTFWQLILCQGLLVGISSGLLFIPSISLVSHYFFKKRALAMGLTVVGSSVGGEYLYAFTPLRLYSVTPSTIPRATTELVRGSCGGFIQPQSTSHSIIFRCVLANIFEPPVGVAGIRVSSTLR